MAANAFSSIDDKAIIHGRTDLNDCFVFIYLYNYMVI